LRFDPNSIHIVLYKLLSETWFVNKTVTEYSKNLLNDMLVVADELVAVPSVGITNALSEPGAAVLRALSSMAQVSQRHQAVVNEALHRAGLSVGVYTTFAVLRELNDQGYIGGLIPLSDGALLLTVTAVGMSRGGIR